MSTFLLAAILFSAPVEFPMESTGVLEAYSFFNQHIEHFIYSNIETDITVLRIGRFSWRLGLAMVTYMGERNDGDLSITFFDSPTLIMRRFFNTWMRAIYDPATKRRNYPADVWSDEFKIHPIMPNGEVSKYGDLFLRVIPVDIGDINYDIADDNSIHRTTVRFVYSVHDVYGKDTRADSYQLGGGSN